MKCNFVSVKTFVTGLGSVLMVFGVLCCKPKSHEEKEKTTDKESAVVDTFSHGTAEVNGIRMYYELHGTKGAYLVLIHGGGSTIGTSFGKILPLLSRSFRVIAVELQGHGHTSDRAAPESFEQDADDVAGLLKSLKIERASFFGFSNGGNTSMQIAHRHPQVVEKLILASSFFKREGMVSGFFEGMTKATLLDMPPALRDAFLQINPDSSALKSMFNKDKSRMEGFKDWKEEMLRSIQAPALIINGDRDVVLPEHALVMSKLIPNSRLMILPATHDSYLSAAENPGPQSILPELTAKTIVEFLLSPQK